MKIETPQEIIDRLGAPQSDEDVIMLMESYAMQFNNIDALSEFDPAITLPEVSDISITANPYYLVRTENFGWQKAMHCQDGWYTSYITKLIVPVIKWKNIPQ